MKHVARLFLLIGLIGLGISCSDDPEGLPSAQVQSERLVANPWLLERVSDTGGRTIPDTELGLQTLALKFLEMQFAATGVVRAVDTKTRQVVNGGSWTLIEGGGAIDVKVNGFNGRFDVIEITPSRLVLRQKVPVNGKDTDANLEFKAAI